ncbi:MAG: T9SS type A sorting domain-containing protein [Flavobacteriales bacterium]|nr:T9SS type A sorting domain-containing protein [Flavobacteriales bacterium]
MCSRFRRELLGLALCANACMALAQWQSLNGGVSWEVRAFAFNADSSRLLVGGGFTWVHQDSLRANQLAWWDGESWSIEGLANGSGDTVTTGSNWLPVVSLALREDTLFASYLANIWQYDFDLRVASMLVNGTWEPCGSPESTLFFMEANGRLFNGGLADTLYGQHQPMVNEWINGAWQPLPGYSFSNSAGVYDVGYWQGSYYFAGTFNAFGSRKIVAFDGVDQWTPLGGGVGGNFIGTLCGYGDSLYVGGYFLPGGSVQSKHAQIWDGQSWRPFFPQVEFVGVVRDMQVYDGALYISGIHTWVGDTTWYGLLRYDGRELCSIGGPMPSGDNSMMAFFQNNLYLGISPQFVQLPGEYIAYLPLEGLVSDRCAEIIASVPEQHAAGRLMLQPNPASDAVTVLIPEHFRGACTLQLLDELGRLVLTVTAYSQNSFLVPLNAVAAGHYTLVLRAGGEELRERLVVAR